MSVDTDEQTTVLKAGTLIHWQGIPFELVSDALVITTGSNFETAQRFAAEEAATPRATGSGSHSMQFSYLFCPVGGCPYKTGACGPRDTTARNALMAHLQRKRHAYSHQEAKVAACRARFGTEAQPTTEASPKA